MQCQCCTEASFNQYCDICAKLKQGIQTSDIIRSLYVLGADFCSDWDEYFLRITTVVASRSKDPSTKVGAVVVKDKTIVSTGYNGLPRGVNDHLMERYEKPLKYKWICHAEENALLNCHRNGLSVDGATIYITPLFPCSKCTGAIIQSGIKRIVCRPNTMSERWVQEFEISKQMLMEAGIEFIAK